MAENLKVTKYSSGDAIPNITSNSEWTNLTTGAYCYIDNSDSNAAVFGALYNWYAVDDSRNIAPDGWHVPTDNDWQILVDFLGGDAIAGGKLKEAGTAHWLSPNTGATNESGFTARAGGLRSSFDGGFVYKGTFANFWSSTRENSDYVWCRQLKYEFEEIWDGVAHYEAGFSIRLVKD
ncbi:fibrobacter succinogenes major paralogous domain-containing protein [candidate division KSB1 bacterium]|nr:fibrobacter succinogenes major paralogous domain-containing protein [candidate division KSB1 bacterium]